MEIPNEVLKLVEIFDSHLSHYKSTSYNETELRREFLDPMFKALGWDIENVKGHADAYKDVVHEDAIKVGSCTKAPDYCFRIGGARKFFVEAKKPSVNILANQASAFQLRRYAWSAKLPISILTNFNDFAVYDTRVKPNKNDNVSNSRIINISYKEYETHWETIESIFSRDAILKGSFDKFAESNKRKRGTAEVDTAFLEEIEKWRSSLARNFALRNDSLTVYDLNYAVQKTIDRIIFLRICEDRGTEEYGRLAALRNGSCVWQRLQEMFLHADDRYNSGLFHFRKEKSRPGLPDHLTSSLELDDSVLKTIIKNLYYPDSPYEFSVLPSDILGQVYEQFLGKTICLTTTHRATVKDKPYVRKAGGVYYTPTYIVKYIVENTLGRLLNGPKYDNPAPIPVSHASRIRIIDPACGSGSFLICAYQYLLDWHLDRYMENADYHTRGKNPKLYQSRGGVWKLTAGERQRILLNSIYGVDIDPQAVEVTKLSLLLKVLEDETSQYYQPDFFSRHQRVLPDLYKNIRSGNSLIGHDFYTQPKFPELDEDSRYRLNVFDWKAAFPEIMRSGGFDCVIGNPPYLSIDDVWGNGDPRLSYLKHAYPEVYNDKTDLLFYFLALALRVGKGEIGMIVSRAFLEAVKGDKLRSQLVLKTGVREVLDFRNYKVFNRADIATAILLLSTEFTGKTQAYHYLCLAKQPDLGVKPDSVFLSFTRNLAELADKPWIFGSVETLALYEKIDLAGVQLGELTTIGQGMQTGANSVFGGLSLRDIQSLSVDPSNYYRRARNSDIFRYNIAERDEYILYHEEITEINELSEGLRMYLKQNSKKLKKRAAYKRENCLWWKFTWPLHKEMYKKRRILCPYLASSNRFALDQDSEFLGLTDTTVIFEPDESIMNTYYLLGLLNSSLLSYRFKGIGKLKGNGIYEYFENTVKKIPIHMVDENNSEEREMHDEIVKLVERIMMLHKQFAAAINPVSQDHIKTQLEVVDRRIDRLVFSLYGLSEDEIKLVEPTHEPDACQGLG